VTEFVVLDASAFLCLLGAEPGADAVAAALPHAAISAVNLAEVVAKLRERGLSADEIRAALAGLSLDVRPFTTEQAYAAGDLRPATRALGLSLGDRACLALARELDAPALTADRQWLGLKLGIDIRVVR
jgi:PIN domain nuclease of toxin-antitoxin system